MTDTENKPFRITETGKYLTRDKRVATVVKRKDGVIADWFGLIDEDSQMWDSAGSAGFSPSDDDIVSRIPDTEEKPFVTVPPMFEAVDDVPSGQVGARFVETNAAVYEMVDNEVVGRVFKDAPPKAQKELDTPRVQTFTASDGKDYPAELFAVQQRVSENTPPEGVELAVKDGSQLPVFQVCRRGRNYYVDDRFVHREERFEQSTWTLAPQSPPIPVKTEPFDEYVRESLFKFQDTEGSFLDISDAELESLSDQIDALHAWKNHILKSEGESA